MKLRNQKIAKKTQKSSLRDKIWRYFDLWILAPGIEPGAPSSEFNY